MSATGFKQSFDIQREIHSFLINHYSAPDHPALSELEKTKMRQVLALEDNGSMREKMQAVNCTTRDSNVEQMEN